VRLVGDLITLHFRTTGHLDDDSLLFRILIPDIHTYIRTYIHTHTYIHTYIVHVHTYTSTHVHTYASTHTHAHTLTHTLSLTLTHAHTHTHTLTHTLTITHTHAGCPKSRSTEILSCDYQKMSNVHWTCWTTVWTISVAILYHFVLYCWYIISEIKECFTRRVYSQ
jgi:hypothetical protein